MPNTIDLTRPVDIQVHRDKLRQVIAAINEDTARLDGLSDARERALSEMRAVNLEISERQEKLKIIRVDEPITAAYRFANFDLIGLGSKHEITQAEQALSKAQAHSQRLSEIIAALESEISTAETRLARLEHSRLQALADLLAASPEFLNLFDEIKTAWGRLRSLKVTLSHVDKELHGYLNTNLQKLYQYAEPLEERVGYSVDEHLVTSWARSLQQLRDDADAVLPSGG